MLSRGMAIVFLFRGIILLILIGIVFFTIMETYNGVLIKISARTSDYSDLNPQ